MTTWDQAYFHFMESDLVPTIPSPSKGADPTCEF